MQAQPKLATIYTDGEYLKKNPSWHLEESPFKAKYVLQMIAKHQLSPKTICEVGCGVGEVLRLIQQGMDERCEFWGYDVSPQAMEMCEERANDGLRYKLMDIFHEKNASFDLILVMDVIEHLEDYFLFLRDLKSKGNLKIFHIPLDL